MSAELIAAGEGAGKLILFGEHSVLYGERAIAVPLERGLIARATRGATGSPPELRLPSLELALSAPPSAESPAVIQRLWEAWAACWRFAQSALERRGGQLDQPPSVCVTLSGPLPFKVGLGSSAALGLALLRVTARCVGVELSPEELDEGAWETERVFHGAPSGLDHTVALRGTALSFYREDGLIHYEALKLKKPLHLAICWVAREGGTAEAVGAVRALLERSPERHRHIKRLGEHARKAEELLCAERPQLYELGELINDAHEELAHLGVSTPQLERLRAELRARGALGAKLTGAGFGGAAFGLFEGAAEAEAAARELKGLSVCFKPTQLDSERSIL